MMKSKARNIFFMLLSTAATSLVFSLASIALSRIYYATQPLENFHDFKNVYVSDIDLGQTSKQAITSEIFNFKTTNVKTSRKLFCKFEKKGMGGMLMSRKGEVIPSDYLSMRTAYLPELTEQAYDKVFSSVDWSTFDYFGDGIDQMGDGSCYWEIYVSYELPTGQWRDKSYHTNDFRILNK